MTKSSLYRNAKLTSGSTITSEISENELRQRIGQAYGTMMLTDEKKPYKGTIELSSDITYKPQSQKINITDYIHSSDRSVARRFRRFFQWSSNIDAVISIIHLRSQLDEQGRASTRLSAKEADELQALGDESETKFLLEYSSKGIILKHQVSDMDITKLYNNITALQGIQAYVARSKRMSRRERRVLRRIGKDIGVKRLRAVLIPVRPELYKLFKQVSMYGFRSDFKYTELKKGRPEPSFPKGFSSDFDGFTDPNITIEKKEGI